MESKKKIYLVQINVTYSEIIQYIPYAAGCLAAYVMRDEFVRENYELGKILFLRKRVEQALEDIEDPYFVGFSCYVWNMEYNKRLAGMIKEKYPGCIIAFGGHNVPSDASLLDECPYVDFLMHGEGERTLLSLLQKLPSGDYSSVHGISFRKDGKGVMNPPENACLPIEDYPSPYTEGYFDEMISEYPDIRFQATLETNRGCPYGCAFCDWCFTDKIRFFPMEKIKAEIDWMSRNKITYCYCADSNFGIADRDLDIARHVVGCNKATGYPQVFKPCYAKNSDDKVFEIGCLLNSNGVDKGVTLAYQSMDPKVLENIGRKNLDIAYYTRLNERYSEAGIPTYTELILGLPGETYDSFCNGLCSLLEAGQHNSMTVYTCQVYCNAPISGPEYREKYDIKWEKLPLHGIHYPADFNGVQEYYDVITSTGDMSKSDWVKANMFSVCLQSFHHLGLLRCFALYCRYEKGMSYFEFYNRLLNYIFSDPSKYICRFFEKVEYKTDHTATSDWCYQNDIFSKVGWYFEEGIFLDFVYNYEQYNREIDGFRRSLGIDGDILAELTKYQNGIIRFPGQENVTVETEYDFYTYFENIYEGTYSPLKKEHTVLKIELEKKIDTWDRYAWEIVWYGKRKSASLCTNPRESIEVIH